ncbi:PDDEXK nuclease domain-containing protein [Pseudomonas sp. MH9.3]
MDDQLRAADDQPTIGLILCKDKDKLDVKHALRDIHRRHGR